MDEDLLKGPDEIGKFLGRSRHSTYKLAEKGLIPSFKIGGILYARKSTLREFFAHMELKQAKS